MMVAYYKLVHGEPEYRAQMLVRADGKWIKRADYEADLAAAHAEIERLKWERDAYRKVLEKSKDEYREDTSRLKGFLGAAVKRTKKAEAERDAALSKLADAERDMRQRAAHTASLYGQGKQGIAASGLIQQAIRALPLKYENKGG